MHICVYFFSIAPQTDLDGIGIPEIHNSSDVNVAGVGESITDVTDKG